MESPASLFPQAVPLLAMLILTAALTGYARWVLGYPICGTDEQNYLQIFDWLDKGGVWPISGPGYTRLILELREWTGWETRALVVAVAAANSALVLPLGLWLWYRLSLGDNRRAWLCMPWLFAGSYFIGPWLEGRPQQLGMLLTASGAWLAHRDLRKHGHCGISFFLLWVFCFGYHALSFVVLTALVFGFWAGGFVQGRSGYGALVALMLGLAGCLALGVLWYPLIWLDIRINHIRGARVVEFFGVLAIVATGGLLLLHGLRRHEIGPRLIRILRAGLASPHIHGLMASGALAALVWQYTWLGHSTKGSIPGTLSGIRAATCCWPRCFCWGYGGWVGGSSCRD